MTRGPGPIGYLTVTRDFRKLAYFAARIGEGDVLVRDLTTGEEKVAPPGSAGGKGYPAISPTGRQLAYGMRMQDRRPIFVADLAAALERMVSDPERAQAMGEASRRRAAEHFAWTSIAERTLDVYRAVLEG